MIGVRGVLLIVLIVLVLSLSGCLRQAESAPYDSVASFEQVKIINYPYEEPEKHEVEVIHELFNTENKALALYRKVLDTFPDETAFNNAIRFSELHIGLMEEFYAKYELSIPEKNWYEFTSDFTLPGEACDASHIFTLQTIEQYGELLKKTDNLDIRETILRFQSDHKALINPFKRCITK